MATDTSPPPYFGRYQVVEELGAGAMGVVYLCVDPRLARPVAVKVLRESEFMGPDEKEQYLARFRHEAEAAGRLNHPDIVQIYDVGPAYLVMEFLEGRPLSALLKAGGTSSVRDVCSLILRVADAVDYAHRHGIIHRDIKPANVMLTNDGGVKVMDFGVARLDTSNLTVVGTVVGSVRYMAPEQMMGQRVDARADIFSLAAMAYELLTGQAPYPGKTITEVVARVVHGKHVPPVQADARFPAALNAVFARAFATRPDDRYPTGMDFARDLYAATEPVLDLSLSRTAQEPDPTAVQSAPTLHVPSTPAGPVPNREGLLLLDSDPSGARVYVDGNPIGTTPLSGVEVSFGRHVVRMETGGREAISAELEVKPERPLKSVSFTLPPPAPRDGPVRPGQFVDFGPEVVPPRRVSGAVPAYPPPARERGLEGAPVVEIWVSETGQVIDAAVLESAGAALDRAVLDAVTGWRFTPATLRGVPVSVRMTLQHLFRR